MVNGDGLDGRYSYTYVGGDDMTISNQEKGMTRWMKIKNVVLALDKKDFSVNDVYEASIGFTHKQIVTTLKHGVSNGFLEITGKQLMPTGGQPANLYSVIKKVEFTDDFPELSGVWRELTMRPYPIPKGRVHLCEAK